MASVPRTYKSEYGLNYKLSDTYAFKEDAYKAMEAIRYDKKHDAITKTINTGDEIVYAVYWRKD